MNASPDSVRARGSARLRLIEAAHQLVRRQGYAATTVDEICAAAGVSKGAFFHHFQSKEALGVAAADHWTTRAAPLFESAPASAHPDPLARVLAHIDRRLALIEGPPERFSCFVGTLAQESFATSDALREASGTSIATYCRTLAADLEAAIARHGIRDDVTALGLAWHIQAVLQGAFVIAKATADPALARDSVCHLRRYITLLFGVASEAHATSTDGVPLP